MTETGSTADVVEWLRSLEARTKGLSEGWRESPYDFNEFIYKREQLARSMLALLVDRGALPALLAVVEAAQEVADAGVETEGGWFVDLDALLRLNHRLDSLHSQASDEGDR